MTLAAAISALTEDGYDTHETALGTIYIADLAPDSGDYDGNTEPGSPWDEECDWLAANIRDIVAPHGCDVYWSDDDLVIEESAA
jgi:hypothetical protein